MALRGLDGGLRAAASGACTVPMTKATSVRARFVKRGAEPGLERRLARRRDAVRELAAELADRSPALRDDVVVVDRLEVHLAREDEVVVVEGGLDGEELARGRRAPSPRRSAAGGGRARRRRARRVASGARRPGALIERSTIPTRSSASSSRAVPTSSVPRPRWLCVASGTSSRIRSTSSPKPASASRSAARPRTSPCAHGQALIPVASTPTTRRAPASVAAAIPISETISWVARPVTGVRRRSGQRATIRTSARSACWRSTIWRRDPVGEHLHEQALAEHDVVDRLVEELGEARHVDALLVAGEVDGALELGRHQDLLGAPADPDRLVDPRHARAREREPDRRRRGLEVARRAGGRSRGSTSSATAAQREARDAGP